MPDAYLKPGAFMTKILNPIMMRVGPVTTLVVSTRRTGREQTVPVNVLDHGGHRYLVAIRGETEWVRNLRASGRCELRRRGQTRAYAAEEVPLAERPAIIAAYRARWDSQVKGIFARLPDPADHPVFRLRPTD